MPRDRFVVCPRCGSRMMYMIEVEMGNSRTVNYYYRCPVCGYKLVDLRIVVRRSDRGVELESMEPKHRLVYPLNIVKK